MIERGGLVRIDGDLDHSELPHRLLLATREVVHWLGSELPGRESSLIGNHLTPLEQVDALVERFVSGRPLAFGRQFKCLRPMDQAVWELKTDDVRIFGFFAKRDCFVALFANFADAVKQHALYTGYVGEVVRLRSELAIEYVEGNDPNGVVSTAPRA